MVQSEDKWTGAEDTRIGIRKKKQAGELVGEWDRARQGATGARVPTSSASSHPGGDCEKWCAMGWESLGRVNRKRAFGRYGEAQKEKTYVGELCGASQEITTLITTQQHCLYLLILKWKERSRSIAIVVLKKTSVNTEIVNYQVPILKEMYLVVWQRTLKTFSSCYSVFFSCCV